MHIATPGNAVTGLYFSRKLIYDMYHLASMIVYILQDSVLCGKCFCVSLSSRVIMTTVLIFF
jgi:hypothetical protein